MNQIKLPSGCLLHPSTKGQYNFIYPDFTRSWIASEAIEISVEVLPWVGSSTHLPLYIQPEGKVYWINKEDYNEIIQAQE